MHIPVVVKLVDKSMSLNTFWLIAEIHKYSLISHEMKYNLNFAGGKPKMPEFLKCLMCNG